MIRSADPSLRELNQLIDMPALERLEKYVQLLDQWRRITNLVSNESFAEVWGRHILDAVYLQRLRPSALTWLDIGSGAGLPGVVIASLLADRPTARVHCVEIDRRKCAFLREVASKISLPLKVHNTPAEEMTSSVGQNVEVVTARAFSSLARILHLAAPQMKKGAVALLPRGRSVHEEVAGLDRALYSCFVTPNPSPGEGVFLQIELRDARAL